MSDKMLKLLKEARPKKSPYDPEDPKNSKNSKPQADPKKPNDPFGTKKRLGKVIKYAAGVIAADVARLEGGKTTGRGRPTKDAVAAKEKKGKGLSKYSDKEDAAGARDITLSFKNDKLILKNTNIDIFDAAFKRIHSQVDPKNANYDAIMKLRTRIVKFMEKNDIDDTDDIDVKFGEYEASDRATNYERGDVEGDGHTYHSPSSKK